MFEKSVSFYDATFLCPAEFERPKGERRPAPGREEVCFRGWADFRKCRFVKRAGFGGALFERRAMFDAAVFHQEGDFEGATFERARTFGFLLLHRDLKLDRAHFDASLWLSASGGWVSCERTQFLGRTTVSLSKADLSLEEAEFAQPSVVEGTAGEREAKPRLRSLRPALLRVRGRAQPRWSALRGRYRPAAQPPLAHEAADHLRGARPALPRQAAATRRGAQRAELPGASQGA